MKNRKSYLVIAIFALAIFTLTNYSQQKNALNSLDSDLSTLLKITQAQAQSEDPGENKRPLYESTSGKYCCGNTQSTSCGAVACN